MTDAPRRRLDELRRFGEALGVALGLAPARAAALTSHLLWFDAAGLPDFGLATLPGYLERIARHEIDPASEGKVGAERPATANFDGLDGVPPLILSRAGALAGEKARDVGVGLVRVRGIGAIPSASAVAAEMAIGPEVAVVLGPGSSWALGLPSPEGLPVVFDTALAGPGDDRPSALAEYVAPWSALVPEGGWLVAALAVAAIEPLATLHERVAALVRDRPASPGLLLPGPWDARRREARERGIIVAEETFIALRGWAERLGVTTLG